ncbi:3-keto-disaccharide hydrolase [Pareuzebyella sediminis]|uniref:3-keto-disaccharide hydrolase n=1 Tax=Pareuzebyella sediminis TaxID=2607998 RepID=UPI0011ED5889|nr:DUF1080 domain-containing protein [Pareuzebyella sediminis]
MKKSMVTYTLLFLALSSFAHTNPVPLTANTFDGMWGLEIESGGVGWLHVHEDQGFLDAELLWIGGSVLPVSHVYLADENTLVVTRTYEAKKSENRTHTVTMTLRIKKSGDTLEGTMTAPKWNGSGETETKFIGKRMPTMPERPDLSKVDLGKSVNLFNGKNLNGWRLIDPESKSAFEVVDGVLVNDPVQPDHGAHISYGNLRTEKEYGDFNLKLEVNVPEGSNSGVYLRGLYEVQVVDSYGKPLDSHNMGAVYSRITPNEAAEKPAGEWQSMDITLVDRHVTVVLNNKKIIDNEPVYGPTGGAISADVLAPGPIYLQGDHGKVSYRNIVLTTIN